MKKIVRVMCFFILVGVLFSMPAYGEGISNHELMEEIKALKARINQLEQKLKKRDKELEEVKKQVGVREKEEEGELPWTDRISLSGAIEVEYTYEHHNLKDPNQGFKSVTSNQHDISLATVELGVDADINKYTKGHLLFLYEEGEHNDNVTIDEGAIRLGGIAETHGLYLQAGRYYPHFGEYNTWGVSDPLTQQVFETQQTAVEVGYENDWISLGAGGFRGDVREEFREEDRINGFFADFNIHPPENKLKEITMLAGLSYMSNVAESDTLQDEIRDINGDNENNNDISDYVDGIAVYLVLEYAKYHFGAEYITALDDFKEGEMGYAMDRLGNFRKTRPLAWNFEFAFNPIEPLTVGIRYEGTDDMYGLFPEHQYGGYLSWELFKYTSLNMEYLRGEYENNNQNADGLVEDEIDLFTVQLAIKF